MYVVQFCNFAGWSNGIDATTSHPLNQNYSKLHFILEFAATIALIFRFFANLLYLKTTLQNFVPTKIMNSLRGDTEKEQAFIRCVLLSLISPYLWLSPHTDPLLPFSPRFLILCYLIASILLFIWIIIQPNHFTIRKVSFTVLDQVIIAYAVYHGQYMIPLVGFSFWVIIGSAFRYGQFFLILSSGIAAIGLLYNIYFSPEWADHTYYGWGFLLSILIVVFYTTVFLKRNDEINRKLNETLSHLSTLVRADNLTGLPNRLAFEERLTQSIAMTKRLRTYLSILYFDLDGFKAINDTFGHNQGDALLKDVAQHVKARLRNTDMLARLGGDEFVIILENNSSPDDAAFIASTLLDTIANIKVLGTLHGSNTYITLGIGASIGIAIYGPNISPEEPTVEELIQRADAAMYQAKQDGKGCYRLEEKLHHKAVRL